MEGPVGATSCFAAASSVTSATFTLVGGKPSAPRLACGPWEVGGVALRCWEVCGVTAALELEAAAGVTAAVLPAAEASAATPASESWLTSGGLAARVGLLRPAGCLTGSGGLRSGGGVLLGAAAPLGRGLDGGVEVEG